MWQNKGEPDCLGVCTELSRLGVSFVNTDFPKGFLGKYTGKVQPEERLPNCLFASIVPAPDGSAGGVWKERPRRKEMIKALQEREFDILIIGGGATGLGTALEATRQGYSVVLLEKSDFACGTSSKSSNMLHGGIRYLQACVQNPNTAAEQIDVVRKGLAEQTYMYNCAPYNLRPYPCMLACYAEKERDLYGKLLYKYDELGDDNSLPESNWNTKKETLFRFPQLRQEGLIGSFIYYDGQQDDARMATLIALTAIENGAVISNYLEVRSLIKEDGITKGAVVTDTDVADGETFDVRAKVVVNATGPFTDAIRKMDEGQGVQNIIKPAAGTHVILPDHFSPDRCGLSILETSDGRALFYLPWMGQTIVGTTDSVSEIKPFLSPPEADIKWIIQEANRYLDPNVSPATEEDVLAAWVGVRPLFVGSLSATGTKDVVPMQPAEDSKGASGDDTKSVPREHAVIVSESRLVTITGGNWTSYRHMAQDTVEEAVKIGKLPALKKQNVDGRPAFEQGFVGSKKGPNVDYDKLQLASAAPFHSDVVELQSKWRFQRDIAENLVASYGTHAIEVACIARRGERMGFAQRLAEGYPWIMAQVVYGARREYACTIPDVLSRRTRLAQIDVLAAYDAIPRIADVMADELQWNQERILREIKEAERFLESCGLDFCRKRHMNVKSQSTATSAA
jgi:glycerol-3-phosphate dehydrogenase